MLRSHSILARILFLHTLALVIAAVFLPFILYRSLDADVDNLQQKSMREQTERIFHYLKETSDSTWSLDLPPGLLDQYSRAYGRYYYAILNDAGEVIFTSSIRREALYPIEDKSRPATFFETSGRNGDQSISGASLKYEIGDKPIWIQVAENMSHRDVLVDDVLVNYFRQISWITIPTMILLLTIDFFIVRRAMRPLLSASEQARNISPARMDVRLPTSDVPNEIRPLVVTFNQALDRLDQGFRTQRDFAADVAHELRTPLSILRTRIETLPGKHKDIIQPLLRDVTGMTRLVNQLLDAAELETSIIDPAEKVDLHEICVDIISFITPFALARGKRVEFTGAATPIIIQGNEEMLRRAVLNLVENAISHTPANTVVEITATPEGIVSVRDRGPGVPVSEREILFERFWRRDRRSGSAGLGLSIVRRIAEAHGGRITITDRPGGGADFSMHLPVPGHGASDRSNVRGV